MKSRILLALWSGILYGALAGCTSGSYNDTSCIGDSIVVDNANPWNTMGEVEKRIRLTAFPDRVFNITSDYQAISGSDISDILRRAISDCHRAGGGRVVIPAGEYYTKAIHLLSNVNLHIEEGAIVKFSTEPTDYAPQVPSHRVGT